MGKKHRWGVIIDAGSSGSRLHVYRWKDPSRAIKDASKEELHSLPKIKTKWTKKIRPGISTFGETPAQVGADHLKELIDYALDIVPEDMVADTPIFLMATAGMRFLPQLQQTALLRETCSYLSQHTSFSLPDCGQNIQVISGETEGLYGWLAANYLLGGFDHPEKHEHGQNHHTYGFLDMGGASAQIAFAPNSTEAADHADNLKLIRLRTLDGNPSEHRVFTATWLGFGVNKARESYVKSLTDAHKDLLISGSDIPDPCMPKGLRTTLDGTLAAQAGGVPTLVGTGDFANCLVSTKPLLAKDTLCGEGAEPCLIHDPVPSIDFNVNHFVGVSEYYHSTHGFFGEKGDMAYDFATYQKKVLDFCNQDWTSIDAKIEGGGISGQRKKDKDVDRTLQDAQQACFKASWVINVLHEGIGIPRVGLDKIPGLNVTSDGVEETKGTSYSTPFRPVDKIEDVEVSWTLGRMLLYAAGQVPPRGVSSSGSGVTAGKGVAVGFGSNSKDGAIPSDFTYAGSSWEPLKIDSGSGSKGHGDADDDWADAADDIFDKARDKSAIPGALFFLLLVLLFAFLLRKKERRVRLYSKFGSFVRRSRWPGSPRKPGRFTSTIGGGPVNGNNGPLAGLAKMLFRRHSRDYERVLEEGQLDQFELGDVDILDDDFISDSSEGSGSSGVHMAPGGGAARRSAGGGLGTPTLSVDKFDDLRSPAASLSAMDRSGLVVRTESRERLGLGGGLGAPSLQMLNAGRRSRATSPTRLKSPMAPLQED
ncbi:Golgi apyrase [Sporothrix curviconia]|uniref:Golgi apyrase n=1 Tax=Sporothrix curviconia TaxID=1260050 RepID=A0ABP0BG20_9PEZI